MRKFWKYLQHCLLVTGACSGLTAVILSEYLATDPKAHLVPDQDHVIRINSKRSHAYISANQNRLLNTLWIVGGVCFVSGLIIGISRGDIKGRRDSDLA